MLKRPLIETGVLAELGHMGAVIVREHLIVQDCVCHLCRDEEEITSVTRMEQHEISSALWSSLSHITHARILITHLRRTAQEVDLQKLRLQVALLLAVVLESL